MSILPDTTPADGGAGEQKRPGGLVATVPTRARPDNISSRTRVGRGEERGTHFLANLEEIRKLVEYSDHRIKPIVYTMLSSGIRLGA